MKDLLAKIEQRLPSSKELLVPGELFFSEALPLPEGIEDADIPQFAEFSIEGMSPFPLDQIRWGFLHVKGSPFILIYAAFLKRLRDHGFKDMRMEFYHAFPDFITGAGRVFKVPTVSFIWHTSSLSALFYPANSPIPELVKSVSCILSSSGEKSADEEEENAEEKSEGEDFEYLEDEDKLSEEKEAKQSESSDSEEAQDGLEMHLDLIEARTAFLTDLDTEGYEVEEGVRIVNEKDVDDQGAIHFRYKVVDETGKTADEISSPLLLSDDELWNADIRDVAFIKLEKKERLFTDRLWKITVLSGVAACILLALELCFFIANIIVDKRGERVLHQAPEVERILADSALLAQIEEKTYNELKVFSMLDIINRNRQQTIYFASAEAISHDKIVIEGKTRIPDDPNIYEDRLKKDKFVKDTILEIAGFEDEVAQFYLTVEIDVAARDQHEEEMRKAAEKKREEARQAAKAKSDENAEKSNEQPTAEGMPTSILETRKKPNE